MRESDTTQEMQIDPGSFRDWSNRVVVAGEGIYRGLMAAALRDWEHLEGSNLFRQFSESEKLIPTRQLETAPVALNQTTFAAWLEHKPVPFVSYPYEWPFSMLKDAALLQLDLLLAALDDGMTLKDGSPYNVQWFGSQPVFIDIPSFTRDGVDAPWSGYRQFCQLCLYPLLLTAYKQIPFHAWLKGSLEGIEPADANAFFSLTDLFRPGIFAHVSLQAKLSARYGDVNKDIKGEVQKAGFNKELVRANVKRLRKLVSRLTWKRDTSTWSHYTDLSHYSDSDANAKKQFVTTVLEQRRRKLIWDLGCNTGTYSELAALHADYVVALDGDHLAVEHFYQRLKLKRQDNILPLVTNFSDPSPNRGWRCRERRALPSRGTPDLVICLALIHHLVISGNIPLSEIVSWLASLGEELIIEFVAKDDPMVRRLLINKHDQYADYDIQHFEGYLQRYFRICSQRPLGSGHRYLYYTQRLPVS